MSLCKICSNAKGGPEYHANAECPESCSGEDDITRGIDVNASPGDSQQRKTMMAGPQNNKKMSDKHFPCKYCTKRYKWG